jgi:hypothetical protein
MGTGLGGPVLATHSFHPDLAGETMLLHSITWATRHRQLIDCLLMINQPAPGLARSSWPSMIRLCPVRSSTTAERQVTLNERPGELEGKNPMRAVLALPRLPRRV